MSVITEEASHDPENYARYRRSRSTLGSFGSLDNLSDIFRKNRFLRKRHSLQPSPCFTLRWSDTGVEELVAVKKGVQLKQVTLPYFDNNLLNVLACDFFLDGSNSALPLHAQSDLLAGHVIHAVKRDSALGCEMKERKPRRSTGSSFSAGKKPSIKLRPAGSLQQLVIRDPDYIEMPSGTLPRIKSQSNTMQRLSRMLSPSKERLDRLNETLQAFNTTGIPTRYSPVTRDSSFHVKEKWLKMENSWEDIVIDLQELTLQDKLQQSVIWELLYTEANYVRNLKAVIEVHLATLIHLQDSDEHLLSDIDVKKMFSNYEEIYVANGSFWRDYLYKLLKATRKTGKPLNIRYLYEGFINISKFFSPYISFCIDTNACREYVQNKKDSDALFGKFLRWADHKIVSDANKEGVKDQLSKPFQRLMRYKLLLDRIKDETADYGQQNMLDAMVDRVAKFVQEVDDRVDASQKFESLMELSKRMDYSIPPESAGEEYARFSEKFPSFNLLLPMPCNGNYREILFEGSLRYRDNMTKWTEVYAFLFTDMFLVTKLSKKGTCERVKVLRPPIKLEKIFIEKYAENPLQYLLYVLDDFGYLRMIHAVTGNHKKLCEWIEKIREAKTLLTDGAIGIDRRKLLAVPESAAAVSLVLTPASPGLTAPAAAPAQAQAAAGCTQTLAITDMRRRFRNSASDDDGTGLRPEARSLISTPAHSHSSLDLGLKEEEEEEMEGLADADGEDEVMMDPHRSDSLEVIFGNAAMRPRTQFLRTASPVQRRHQQHLRQSATSPPTEAGLASAPEPCDQPAADDNPCDMGAAAFRNRRGSRGDRRYRTADSVVPPGHLAARSASIHKRLSLNYGGTGLPVAHEASATASLPPTSPTGVPGLPATSVESFQSSSGFSSSGSAQHLHSGSDFSEPGGVHEMLIHAAGAESMGSSPTSTGRPLEAVGPLRDRGPMGIAAKRMTARHCMSLNDLSRLHLDTISDTNDNEEDSPEGNSSSTSVRSVLKQYVVVHSSDGEATDV